MGVAENGDQFLKSSKLKRFCFTLGKAKNFLKNYCLPSLPCPIVWVFSTDVLSKNKCKKVFLANKKTFLTKTISVLHSVTCVTSFTLVVSG